MGNIGNSSELMRSIKALPKIDLHRHLTGSISAKVAINTAIKYDLRLPSYIQTELDEVLFGRSRFNTLGEYFKPWEILNGLFESKEIVHDIVLDVIREQKDDGVIYSEIRVGPRGFLGKDDLDFEQYLGSILKAVKLAEEQFDVYARIVIGLPRHVFVKVPKHIRVKMFIKMFEIIREVNNGYIVGVDLNGDESICGPDEFWRYFEFAKKEGLKITVHAGEVGPAKYVEYALNEIGASRIGHGYTFIKNIREETAINAAFEICPTSNLMLSIMNNISELPIINMRKYNIPFAICTDNPARCKTSMTEEYFKIAKTFNLSVENIRHINKMALKYSFADEVTKGKIESKIRENNDER